MAQDAHGVHIRPRSAGRRKDTIAYPNPPPPPSSHHHRTILEKQNHISTVITSRAAFRRRRCKIWQDAHGVHIRSCGVRIGKTRANERLRLFRNYRLRRKLHPVRVHDHLLPKNFFLRNSVKTKSGNLRNSVKNGNLGKNGTR